MELVKDFSEINEAIIKIKNCKKKLLTNFYPNREKNEIWIFNGDFYKIESGDTIFFFKKHSDFYSLFFISSCNESLEKSLSELTLDFEEKMLVVDIVQREEKSDLLDIFHCQFFNHYTSLVRMSRLNAKEDFPCISVEGIKEATDLHLFSLENIFKEYFDEKSEQIPDRNELQKWIKNKNILIYEDGNSIGGFLVYEIIGSTLYLRYWFVHPDFREKKIGSKLFKMFESKGRDANRHLFWVIKSNENAIKRYRHYGFVEEKMYNFVLTNKNIKYEE